MVRQGRRRDCCVINKLISVDKAKQTGNMDHRRVRPVGIEQSTYSARSSRDMSCVAWSRLIGHGTHSRLDRLDVDVSLMCLVDLLSNYLCNPAPCNPLTHMTRQDLFPSLCILSAHSQG